MKLSICTDVYADLNYVEMLDKVKSLGVNGIEVTAGGWGAQKHCPTQKLLSDDNELKAYQEELAKRDMEIVALNCSCNPLWPSETGEQYSQSMYDCVLLAEKLGLKKIICMAGLPAGSPTDTVPNWITATISWPDYSEPAYNYQWETTIAWWKDFAKFSKQHGIEKIAIEEFPGTMVYNAETLWKLRNAVDPIIGINLDPSHMIALGADPIAAARNLKGAIYHVHGKDTRLEKTKVEVNGLPEWKDVTDVANRNWNYVAVGCGQDLQWWKEFFSVCGMMGYDGYVSLEMEDFTMSTEAGVITSIDALKQTISK